MIKLLKKLTKKDWLFVFISVLFPELVKPTTYIELTLSLSNLLYYSVSTN